MAQLQNPITKMPFQKTMPSRDTQPINKPMPFRSVAKYADFQPNPGVTSNVNPMGSLAPKKAEPTDGNFMQSKGGATPVNTGSIVKDLTKRKKTAMGSEDLNQRSGSAGQIPNQPVVATNSFPMRPASLRKPESLTN